MSTQSQKNLITIIFNAQVCSFRSRTKYLNVYTIELLITYDNILMMHGNESRFPIDLKHVFKVGAATIRQCSIKGDKFASANR
jgi:hypothetical protein